MRVPPKKVVEAAKREIAREDREALERVVGDVVAQAQAAENERRSSLPSEHPEHIHGMMCDGQDGMNSYCERLRRKLGYP